MATKGFNFKLLVFTNDGETFCTHPFEDCDYVLLYNISNRSYQLAGKKRIDSTFTQEKMNELILEEKVDFILSPIKVKDQYNQLKAKIATTQYDIFESAIISFIDMVDELKDKIDNLSAVIEIKKVSD